MTPKQQTIGTTTGVTAGVTMVSLECLRCFRLGNIQKHVQACPTELSEKTSKINK